MDDRFSNGQSSGQQPSAEISPEPVHTILTIGGTESTELKSAEAVTPATVQPVRSTTPAPTLTSSPRSKSDAERTKENREREAGVKAHAEEEKGVCRDRHDLCKFWSSIGECESNKDWMAQHCAISCDKCNGRFFN